MRFSVLRMHFLLVVVRLVVSVGYKCNRLPKSASKRLLHVTIAHVYRITFKQR